MRRRTRPSKSFQTVKSGPFMEVTRAERGYRKPITMREDLGGEYNACGDVRVNLARIRRDIVNAQQHFEYVEAHPTDTGGLMALVALQTARRVYTLAVTFPHTYPSAMPNVFVRRPALENSPHQYPHDRICYFAPEFLEPRASRSEVCHC